VTQKDIHIANMAQLVELLEAENMRRQVLLICGGPRLSHELAIELGYDAGFGPGTMPSQVASFIAQAMAQRLTGHNTDCAETNRYSCSPPGCGHRRVCAGTIGASQCLADPLRFRQTHVAFLHNLITSLRKFYLCLSCQKARQGASA